MTDQPLRIGAAARLLGTTPRTLRYYEEFGLLGRTRRSQAGQRRYDAIDLERLRAVLRLRDLGLPLRVIRDLLDADTVTALGQVVEAQRSLTDLLARRGQPSSSSVSDPRGSRRADRRAASA